MGWLRRKSDPLQTRERDLNIQIAELEARIRRLSAQLPASPAGPGPVNPVSQRVSPAKPAPAAPVAERAPVSRPAPAATMPRPAPKPPAVVPESAAHPELYNELGVRKFDLVGWWQRWTAWWRPPPPSNPHLVKYLAYGGLREPVALRFEKRVARNRFLLLVGAFLVVLWILLSLLRHNQ
ncbi:hypothetical protein NXS98_08740 [Fontisphaera persica]|uniref:hypothetical protein n=1 Tax=Fontisphaera persica TaxID=2974023 RepID=UPI0024C05547|nr:hypothetical protein [Fontisphaera persica]WCJ57822.1 hypothetical protein NXS98_08740 [Fontisphaera persica]